VHGLVLEVEVLLRTLDAHAQILKGCTCVITAVFPHALLASSADQYANEEKGKVG
jgi:hypothetical protein